MRTVRDQTLETVFLGCTEFSQHFSLNTCPHHHRLMQFSAKMPPDVRLSDIKFRPTHTNQHTYIQIHIQRYTCSTHSTLLMMIYITHSQRDRKLSVKNSNACGHGCLISIIASEQKATVELKIRWRRKEERKKKKGSAFWGSFFLGRGKKSERKPTELAAVQSRRIPHASFSPNGSFWH